MNAIKIYAQDSKYYMEDLNTNTTVEVTKITHEKKTGKDWLTLPENSANRTFVSIDKINRYGELVLEYKESRTLGPRDPEQTSKTDRPKTPRLSDLAEYLTEDEHKIYEELKAKAMARYAKVQKQNALDQMKKQIADLEAEIAQMD